MSGSAILAMMSEASSALLASSFGRPVKGRPRTSSVLYVVMAPGVTYSSSVTAPQTTVQSAGTGGIKESLRWTRCAGADGRGRRRAHMRWRRRAYWWASALRGPRSRRPGRPKGSPGSRRSRRTPGIHRPTKEGYSRKGYWQTSCRAAVDRLTDSSHHAGVNHWGVRRRR